MSANWYHRRSNHCAPAWAVAILSWVGIIVLLALLLTGCTITHPGGHTSVQPPTLVCLLASCTQQTADTSGMESAKQDRKQADTKAVTESSNTIPVSVGPSSIPNLKMDVLK